VADSAWFWVVLIAAIAAVYALPMVIALIRQVENITTVVILNLFPLAWPAALVLACMLPRKDNPPSLAAPLRTPGRRFARSRGTAYLGNPR
jgi:hypothetical protein